MAVADHTIVVAPTFVVGTPLRFRWFFTDELLPRSLAANLGARLLILRVSTTGLDDPHFHFFASPNRYFFSVFFGVLVFSADALPK